MGWLTPKKSAVRARNAVQMRRWPVRLLPVLGPVLACALALVLVGMTLQPIKVAAFCIAITAAVAVFTMPPGDAFKVYLSYLICEGAFKILSNYNPIIHVGSDILLCVTFLRLFLRWRAARRQDSSPLLSREGMAVLQVLMLFWLWVLVQFFNPWGLGFFPSLASLKIYVVPTLVFFIGAFFLTNEELLSVPFLVVTLGLFEASVATVDGIMGDSFVPSLHPRYIATMGVRFVGILYRPFGTTALPGGPAVWMTHCAVSALAVMHILRCRPDYGSAIKRVLQRTVVGLFYPLAISAIVLCQVRSTLVRFSLLTLLGVLMMGSRKALLGIGILVASLVVGLPILDHFARQGGLGTSEVKRAIKISERFTSLGDKSAWESAREGAWGAMVRLSKHTSLGIGLSRVGAAAGPWMQRIERDPVFGNQWSFADNVYRALFTEMGVGGLLSYLAVIATIMILALKRGTFEGRVGFLNCCVFILMGFGSEGVLYQPDATFFWFYAAWALRADARLPTITKPNAASRTEPMLTPVIQTLSA